jgi:hypothetical protein
VAAISKRFELESWDWAHSLRMFELFPIVIKSLVVGGTRNCNRSSRMKTFVCLGP